YPNAPLLTWPATRVDIRFTGSALAVTLDDELGKNFYNAFINENWAQPRVLELAQGEHTYLMVKDLPEGEHQLTLFKRTEGEEGATALKAIYLLEGGALLEPPAKPTRRIEIYGDSITSGMGNMAPLEGEDGNLADKNSFLSYGAIAARSLDAEYRSISQSGIGIMVSWFDFTMPDFFDQLSAVGDNDSQWDFSQWAPQVVVINLFQNDSWLVEKRLDPVPDGEARIKAYMDFIKEVHNRYPEALIICALGSMDATQRGSAWPWYIEQAVDRYREAHPTAKLETLFFPYEDFGKHPRVIHHRANAALLVDLIKRKMDW
ncbi:MAG TPA: GDSL-type esterase/lipase family protein, partial [Cellvibrionaceae bacterium]